MADGRKLDKRDPLVIKLKEWVDEEYEKGRQTPLTSKEIRRKVGELAETGIG